MSYSFETFQGVDAQAVMPVGIDLTGHTVTVEISNNSRFEEIITSIQLAGQTGHALTFNLGHADVELCGDSFFRVKIGSQVVQHGSIDYNPRPVGDGLTESQVLDLINQNSSGSGQTFALAPYNFPALGAGETGTVTVDWPYEVPFMNATIQIGTIPLTADYLTIRSSDPLSTTQIEITYSGIFNTAYAGGASLVWISSTPVAV